MRKKWPALFCLAFVLMGCSASESLNVGNYQVVGTIPDEETIDSYLEGKLFPAEFGDIDLESAKCSHDLLTAEQGLDNRIYIIADCTGRYIDAPSSATPGFGDNPLVIDLDPNDATSVIGHQATEDGSGHGDSIKRLFPKSVWEGTEYS